jgi:molybdate transport system substrate-binding protein
VNTTGRRVVVLLVALAWLLAACSSGATPSPSSAAPPSAAAPSVAASAAAPSVEAAPLTVFGAASLKNALGELKKGWEARYPGSTITISTDSSAALETQIEQGAPADVFLSADTTNPKKLTDKGLADGDAVQFAGNLLTVITPAAKPVITSPMDLAKAGTKVIAAGDDVPITKYANQAVANLAKVSGYPADFEAAYKANIVSKEQNVSGIVTKVGAGEGDGGIVYVTDAKASKDVTPVEIPAEDNVPATYAGVVVKASSHVPTAHAFLDWVAGPEGQTILGTFGFLPPSG